VISSHQYERHREDSSIKNTCRSAEYQDSPFSGPQAENQHSNTIVDHATNVNSPGAKIDKGKNKFKLTSDDSSKVINVYF